MVNSKWSLNQKLNKLKKEYESVYTFHDFIRLSKHNIKIPINTTTSNSIQYEKK